MKITLEVSDAICKRIKAAAGQKQPVSVGAFVQRAVENELERVERHQARISDDRDLVAFARELQRLERGQRTIVALMNSSATVLATLLRRHGE